MKPLLFALLLVSLAGRAVGNPAVEAPPAPASAAAPPLSPQARAQAFDTVWQRIRDHYVDPGLRGLDWEATGAAFRPQALAASTDEQFWAQLDRMTAELGDAHTQVLSPRHYANFRRKQAMAIGLLVREVEGELVVTHVKPGSEAQRQGLRAGDVLRSIQGQPALDWWRAALAGARKNSSLRAQEATALMLLNTGGLDAAEPPPLTVELAPAGAGPEALRRLALTPSVVSRNLELSTRVLPSGFGYLRLSAFDDSLGRDYALLNRLFDLHGTPGIVIDLRRNPGGSMEMAVQLMTGLIAKKVSAGKVITRTGKPITALFGLVNAIGPEVRLHGTATPYRGAVVVLVDEFSASAAEFTAAALQGLGRAKVVGRTSCGCLLGVRGFVQLPGGGALSFSELDFEPAGSARVEGKGVVPDVEVPLTRAGLQSGSDPELEAAERLLASLAARTPPGAAAGSAR